MICRVMILQSISVEAFGAGLSLLCRPVPVFLLLATNVTVPHHENSQLSNISKDISWDGLSLLKNHWQSKKDSARQVTG